jgi:ATP-dependent protease ClpP protease subunit
MTPTILQPPGRPIATPRQTPQAVYVSFSAEINVNTTETLIAAMSNIVNQGVRDVHLLMSSPGGMVMCGLNLYNTLRGLPIHLTTHNVGNMDSIGNTVFLAGETRYACPHSTFMFHGVAFPALAGQQFDEKTLLERLGSLKADQKRIGSIIKERTSLDESAIAGLFLEAQTKDAGFALTSGIVHEIREVQIPMGCPIVPLVFQR